MDKNTAANTEALGQEELRQQVIEQLSGRYATGDLEVEEFERRVEQAERAETEAALRLLLVPPTASAISRLPKVPRAPVTSLVRSASVPRRKTLLSLFSRLHRGDLWQVPQRLRVVAMAGGVDPVLATNRVEIMRLDGNRKPIMITARLDKVLRRQEEDVTLKDNDVVVVNVGSVKKSLFVFKQLMPGSSLNGVNSLVP